MEDTTPGFALLMEKKVIVLVDWTLQPFKCIPAPAAALASEPSFADLVCSHTEDSL